MLRATGKSNYPMGCIMVLPTTMGPYVLMLLPVFGRFATTVQAPVFRHLSGMSKKHIYSKILIVFVDSKVAYSS